MGSKEEIREEFPAFHKATLVGVGSLVVSLRSLCSVEWPQGRAGMTQPSSWDSEKVTGIPPSLRPSSAQPSPERTFVRLQEFWRVLTF